MAVLVWVQQKVQEPNQKNKMTEKNYNPKQREKSSIKKLEATHKVKKPDKVETPKKESEIKKVDEVKIVDDKVEIPKTEKKPEIPKIKKTEVSVNISNSPISTKSSAAVCNFIRGKKIEFAIKELELVARCKKAIPAKGEYAHKKGKRMSGGIFATKTVQHFLIFLKSLLANANAHNIENAVIVKAIANIGSRPYGRFGRSRKKRTNITLIAKEKYKENKKNGRKKYS